MMLRETTTGIILAGGKSARMGHDKGLLSLQGKPFMEHIIEAMEPFVNTIIIVSNSSDYDVFNKKRVLDIVEDSGPLAGLYTGLYHSETENNLVLSCDVPLINAGVLNELMEGFDAEKEVIQLESEGKKMPLIAMYKKQCMHHFKMRLDEGERRLQIAITELNTKTISVAPRLQGFVRNINTRRDLKEISNDDND